jgi:hypothetical protein
MKLDTPSQTKFKVPRPKLFFVSLHVFPPQSEGFSKG